MSNHRLIAFYLPQYHPIPENDRWWGPGFTEWTNVTKARPLFPWHSQPQLPADLGFYDLRVPETRLAQAELAAAYGIYGFCYYHYWFNGRRLLERPFNEVLSSGQPGLPFCLCWANENWTRAWDGLEQDVLIQINYSPEDDRQHMRWLARAFRDKRYIRVAGKPLFLVYRVSNLPHPRQTAAVWRDEARQLGIGEIYLCTVESLRGDRIDPRLIDFDAAVEFQPDWLNIGPPRDITRDNNQVLDYATLVERMLQKPAAAYKRFPGITPGWDNTSRRQKDAFIFKDTTPQLYQYWLEQSLKKFEPYSAQENFVFINAWNEWGEGAYLEPSQKWGRAYLEATRSVLQNNDPTTHAHVVRTPTPNRANGHPLVSVCIPTYNGGKYLAAAIQSVLNQTFTGFELIIVDDCSTDNTAAIVRSFDAAAIRYVQNPHRLGLVGNWNKCLELAQGKYIYIFHQDDIMLPHNLACKVDVLEDNPQVGFVHSNVQQIDAQGAIISNWWYDKPTANDTTIYASLDYFSQLLAGVNIVCCPSVMIRKECYEQWGGFDDRLPFTTDWEMWLRLAAHYDVAYLPQALVQYRRHDKMETLSHLGVKELWHAYQAKVIALDKNAELALNIPALRSMVTENYTHQAIECAAQHYQAHELTQAKDYLVFVGVLRAVEHNAAETNGNGVWPLNALELVECPVPQQQPETRPADNSITPDHVQSKPLRTESVYFQVIDEIWARDIAARVPVKKIVKALMLKLSYQRGFRWLQRLRGPVKSMLKW